MHIRYVNSAPAWMVCLFLAGCATQPHQRAPADARSQPESVQQQAACVVTVKYTTTTAALKNNDNTRWLYESDILVSASTGAHTIAAVSVIATYVPAPNVQGEVLNWVPKPNAGDKRAPLGQNPTTDVRRGHWERPLDAQGRRQPFNVAPGSRIIVRTDATDSNGEKGNGSDSHLVL